MEFVTARVDMGRGGLEELCGEPFVALHACTERQPVAVTVQNHTHLTSWEKTFETIESNLPPNTS